MRPRILMAALALALSPTLLTSMPAWASDETAAPHSGHSTASRDKKLALHDGMRELWEEHVLWTRAYVVSNVASLPDKEATTQRLLKNQEDIGDAIKPYFGDEAGTKLTALLKEHIVIATEVVDAAKAKDSAKVKLASEKWTANADQISEFLSKANPQSWPLDSIKPMMREHLKLTTEGAVAQIEGRYADSVATFDKIEDQARMMADTLSNGIVKKFPGKFQERQAQR